MNWMLAEIVPRALPTLMNKQINSPNVCEIYMISKQKTNGRRERVLTKRILGSARAVVKRRKPITGRFAEIVKTWNLMTELTKRYINSDTDLRI